MNKKEIIKKIVKDCFWDKRISEEDIIEIVEGNDFRKKKALFEKILFNFYDRVKGLSIFKEEDLKKILTEYKPVFRSKSLKKDIDVLKKVLFDQSVKVESLEWKYRII